MYPNEIGYKIRPLSCKYTNQYKMCPILWIHESKSCNKTLKRDLGVRIDRSLFHTTGSRRRCETSLAANC